MTKLFLSLFQSESAIRTNFRTFKPLLHTFCVKKVATGQLIREFQDQFEANAALKLVRGI